MKITVKIKSSFGNRRIYPVCETAQAFADIAGTNTLTDTTLRIIKRLGYSIEIEQPQINL